MQHRAEGDLHLKVLGTLGKLSYLGPNNIQIAES